MQPLITEDYINGYNIFHGELLDTEDQDYEINDLEYDEYYGQEYENDCQDHDSFDYEDGEYEGEGDFYNQ